MTVLASTHRRRPSRGQDAAARPAGRSLLGRILLRERLLERAIADLRAPLHENSYLSATQFAEKIGLKTGSDPLPPTGDLERAGRREGSDPFTAATARTAAAVERVDGPHDEANAAAPASTAGSDPVPSEAMVQSDQGAASPSRVCGDRVRGNIAPSVLSFLVILAAAVAPAAALAISAVAGRTLFGIW